MKILYITTVGITMNFFVPLVQELKKKGYCVDIATNNREFDVPEKLKEIGCKIYQIDCVRFPLNKNNIKTIQQIQEILNKNDYNIVHCHTPIAAACTRIACKSLRKNGLKVIYTAHGFHFYKGAPIKNWLIYYPIEKICAKWTDVLITINKEDYERAKQRFHGPRIEYVPGVGIDVDSFADVTVDKKQKREELGIPTDVKIILSVGELNENKNHKSVIEAISKINDSSIYYLIAGLGDKAEELESLAHKLGVNLKLLGQRKDLREIYKVVDLYIHPSIREGLPVTIMEVMAAGTPIACSNIRGCVDEVKEGLFAPNDIDDIAKTIKEFLYNNKDNSEENYRNVDQFDSKNINKAIIDIYNEALGNNDK